jgi:hypothetical protein
MAMAAPSGGRSMTAALEELRMVHECIGSSSK